MIEVLYAHQDGSITGSAISLLNLLMALDRDKYSPRVVLFSDGPARELYEKLSIPVDVVKARPFWTCPGSAWMKLGFYINLLALLPNKNWDRYLKGRRPLLLHANDKSCLQAGIAARKQSIPVVWHLRSSYVSSASHLQAKISANVIQNNADAMIAISEDEVDGFEDFNNLHIIHNSLDFDKVRDAVQSRQRIRKELGITPDEVLVGQVVTSLNWVRGTWDFLNIAGRVFRMTHTPLKFLVVGTTTDESREQAQKFAQQNEISNRLILTGFRSDALALIAAMDVLVVCNHHGVLGRPPFEAMAVGTSVAAWQGHSLRSSVVRDGETALLARHGDSEALTRSIIRLVDDPLLRRTMGLHGVKYVHEHFDPHRNAQAVQHVYQKVLQAKKKVV